MNKTGFLAASWSFVNSVTLSTFNILKGGTVGKRLNGGMSELGADWAIPARTNRIITRVQAIFFMPQRNDFLLLLAKF